jgi:hypothetical protein
LAVRSACAAGCNAGDRSIVSVIFYTMPPRDPNNDDDEEDEEDEDRDDEPAVVREPHEDE